MTEGAGLRRVVGAEIPSGKTIIISRIAPVRGSAGWSVSIGAFVSIYKILIIHQLYSPISLAN